MGQFDGIEGMFSGQKHRPILGCNGPDCVFFVRKCTLHFLPLQGPTLPDMNYDLFGPIFDGDFLPFDFEKLINETKPKRTILGVTESDPLGYSQF